MAALIGWATLGTVVGALLRFELSRRIVARAGDAFPWATLAVNLTGGLVMGCLLHVEFSPAFASLLLTGILGGFTTVSTFALEAVLLGLRRGAGRATVYVLASALGVPLAVWLGTWLVR